jgi:pimeloyl-ACP methyl ester carboxylesterase
LIALIQWKERHALRLPIFEAKRIDQHKLLDGNRKHQRIADAKHATHGVANDGRARDGTDIVAWSRARLAEMIFTQPVVYELERIRPPTLLLIGQKDRTAPGAARAPSEIASKLGNYPALGRNAAKRIPHATLIEFPELGHAPQIQSPAQFHDAILKGLAALPH